MEGELQLQLLLKHLAESDAGADHGFTFYGPGVAYQGIITYRELHEQSMANARSLECLPGWKRRAPVLLVFSTDREELLWFWSALMADMVPVSFPIRTGTVSDKISSWTHLKNLLENPFVLSNLPSNQLDIMSSGRIFSTNTMQLHSIPNLDLDSSDSPTFSEQVAYLGLTSGSTASAKAVPVFHSRALINASKRVKFLNINKQSVTLDSISSDHFTTAFCSNILPGMLGGGSVVVVYTDDAVTRPLDIFRCMTKHAVTHRYESNSRLVLMLQNTSEMGLKQHEAHIDLSQFRHMVTSGDRAQTSRCIEFNKLMHRLGAPPRTVVPCFGMSEMQGSFIASMDFPKHDLECGNLFACVGKPMPGLQVRILDDRGEAVLPHQIGWLEMKSSTIFPEYFNNEVETSAVFSDDGWFKTLDLATIDDQGMISVLGRSGEVINCQADMFFPVELEMMLKSADIKGVDSTTFTVIKHYDERSGTDVAVVLFTSLDNELFDQQARNINAILSPVMQWDVYDIVNVRPEVVKRSPRGKINRRALSSLYAQGVLHNKHYKLNFASRI